MKLACVGELFSLGGSKIGYTSLEGLVMCARISYGTFAALMILFMLVLFVFMLTLCIVITFFYTYIVF